MASFHWEQTVQSIPWPHGPAWSGSHVPFWLYLMAFPHRLAAVATLAFWHVFCHRDIHPSGFLCSSMLFHACFLLIFWNLALKSTSRDLFPDTPECRSASPPSTHYFPSSICVCSSVAFITGCRCFGCLCLSHILSGFYIRVNIRAGTLSTLPLW